ncbi:MAG: hypothetical protein J6M02_00320 [Clostridia bacterium]|nr:hypothetical protein [Clostridia bacterium]
MLSVQEGRNAFVGTAFMLSTEKAEKRDSMNAVRTGRKKCVCRDSIYAVHRKGGKAGQHESCPYRKEDCKIKRRRFLWR